MLPDLCRLPGEPDLNSVGELTTPGDLVAIGILDGGDIVPIGFWNFEDRADPVRRPANGGILRCAASEFPERLDVLVVWRHELTAVETFEVQTYRIRQCYEGALPGEGVYVSADLCKVSLGAKR